MPMGRDLLGRRPENTIVASHVFGPGVAAIGIPGAHAASDRSDFVVVELDVIGGLQLVVGHTVLVAHDAPSQSFGYLPNTQNAIHRDPPHALGSEHKSSLRR